MNVLLLLGVTMAFSQISLSTGQIETTIKQVYVIMRDEARSPLSVYPTDQYGVTYWNRYGGLGQLTSRGLLQSYNFGQFLKNYYNNFLTPYYLPTKVYARSIDIDRSLMTASSFLSGMYPPATSDQLWSPSVTWYPIPIHTTGIDCENIFYPTCPKYEYLINQTLSSTYYRDMERKNIEFLRKMSTLSGWTNMSYYTLPQIYDNALAKMWNNLELESWITDSFDNLTQAQNFVINLMYGSVAESKLVSGGLLYDIVKNIRKKFSLGSSNELMVYSCQDSHLLALSNLLNVTQSEWMTQYSFGAALILELRQDLKGLYYIQVLAKNNSINQPIALRTLKMSQCADTLCPLGNFLDLTADKVVVDYGKECSMFNSTSNSTNSTDWSTWSNCTSNSTTMSSYQQSSSSYLSKLEIALIIVSSTLAIFILFLLGILCISMHRNRVRKTVF